MLLLNVGIFFQAHMASQLVMWGGKFSTSHHYSQPRRPTSTYSIHRSEP